MTSARLSIAEPRDMQFVKSAIATATGELGFIVWPKLDFLQQQGDIAILTCNGDRCGFVVHGRTPPLVKIWQIWIRDDARRIEHGRELVAHVIRTSAKHDASGISLRCAVDLEAISFWTKLGFERLRDTLGGKRRHRTIATFHRSMTSLEQLGLIGSSAIARTLSRERSVARIPIQRRGLSASRKPPPPLSAQKVGRSGSPPAGAGIL